MSDWVYDDNGNKCSIAYFGSLEAAQFALDSLYNCINCTNCKNCYACQNCIECYDCICCSNCHKCNWCSNCYRCTSIVNYSNQESTRNKIQQIIVPIIPNIHNSLYHAVTVAGKLNMDHWHTCQTTHCRAGWITTLGGEAGKALEGMLGTPLAARIIYQANGCNISWDKFYETNTLAMKDIKRWAVTENEWQAMIRSGT